MNSPGVSEASSEAAAAAAAEAAAAAAAVLVVLSAFQPSSPFSLQTPPHPLPPPQSTLSPGISATSIATPTPLPWVPNSKRQAHLLTKPQLPSTLYSDCTFQVALSVLADAFMSGGGGAGAAWALEQMEAGTGRDMRMMNAVVAGDV